MISLLIAAYQTTFFKRRKPGRAAKSVLLKNGCLVASKKQAMNITLICLGKLKESYWREAEAEYLKRLSSTYKITIRELKERSFSEKDDPATIKLQESELIKNELKKAKTGPILALSENGQQYSSSKLAEIFKNFAASW